MKNENITDNLGNELVDQYANKEKAANWFTVVVLTISFVALVYGLVIGVEL